MMIVAAVNLVINFNRQGESETDIRAVKFAYDRLDQMAVNLVLIRVLLNVANGYEPNISEIIPDDRYLNYKT